MQVGPQDRRAHSLYGVQEMVMIVPINADVDETQDVIEKDRQKRLESGKGYAVRHLEFQHHNGDDDRNDAIAERLQSSLAHGRIIATATPANHSEVASRYCLPASCRFLVAGSCS